MKEPSLAASVAFATPGSATPAAPAKDTSPVEKKKELVFPENIAEAPLIFQSISSQPIVKNMRIQQAELLKAYDASLPPMKTSGLRALPADNAPPAETLPGAWSAQPLQGEYAPIMLFGPYEEVTPGEYLVVYRLRILAAPTGRETLFFDVACNACTTGGARIPASDFGVGKWVEVAIPVTVPVDKKLEFRFWHGGAKTAVDRIYLFRVTLPDKTSLADKTTDGEVPAGRPVEGRSDVLRSPYGAESGMIDVSGFPAGSRIKCPYSGKIFRIP